MVFSIFTMYLMSYDQIMTKGNTIETSGYAHKSHREREIWC
jgi:hypothetical protein